MKPQIDCTDRVGQMKSKTHLLCIIYPFAVVFMKRVSFVVFLPFFCFHYSYYRTEVGNKICQVVILNYNCIVVIGACVRCSRHGRAQRHLIFANEWIDAEKTNDNTRAYH